MVHSCINIFAAGGEQILKLGDIHDRPKRNLFFDSTARRSEEPYRIGQKSHFTEWQRGARWAVVQTLLL